MPGETLVIKARALVLAVLVAACGGGSTPSTVAPKTSARGAVDAFMQAVADSNLAQMASLWGSSAGPAAKTRQPADWERRIEIMQAYLQNETHRVVSDAPAGSDARHAVQVEIRRGLCTWDMFCRKPGAVFDGHTGKARVFMVDPERKEVTREYETDVQLA